MRPAFKDNNITVVLASSAYYVPYMAVTIKSIIETADEAYRYDIIIMHKEVTIEDQNKLQMEEKENVSIRFLRVDKKLDELDYNYRPGYAPESFYRVVMPYILEEYENAIWVDCDIIAKRSISDLFVEAKKYTQDKCIAASKDIDGMASCISDHEYRKQYMYSVLKIKRLEEYFQSGVMFFNFKKIREKYTLDDLVNASCNPEIMYGDQDVLNYLYNGDLYYLDMSWNTITNAKRKQVETLLLLAPTTVVDEYLEARKHPYLIHLATKPWNDPICEGAEEFWDFARKTMFYEEVLDRWRVR